MASTMRRGLSGHSIGVVLSSSGNIATQAILVSVVVITLVCSHMHARLSDGMSRSARQAWVSYEVSLQDKNYIVAA